ncbi:cullin-9 [Bombina bombina]|uniref:cullin-9 n=1 Tax=Bombina bombina TaxID=8345 RepID=UPI00235A907F|nr:cullin-9 [Bombina bombina]
MGHLASGLYSAMLVGERRNGNLVVQLAPKLQAQPEELLRQRWSPGGHTEYLIRWAVQNLEEASGSTGAASQGESKAASILMWMSAEEVYTNCPTLLGKRKSEGSGLQEEEASRAADEGALQEMREDVRMLVQRASRQMSQSSGPDSSVLNTIHVLSAYASIGSLAGVFKETGALDLLMKMLCNQEKQIRNNAGKMLRALASHDAGSRAHVLLSLSQQDGIEQHMDFESRYTLLQLFAETTSSEEHCISFEGIHLPQIPGKQLFSLVKRYLCVTSLLDQLSSEQLDHGEKSRLQRQFDVNIAMGSLICELVRVMGWVREHEPDTDAAGKAEQPRVVRSIFQPKTSTSTNLPIVAVAPARPTVSKRKQVKDFMSPPDFPTRNSYVDYIQETLKAGMTVRMLEDYDEISAGDEGVFRQSNNGTPPVQVLWRSTGRTYWVHWHMVEIIDAGEQTEEDTQEKLPLSNENLKVSTTVTQMLSTKPSGGGLYTLPYLTGVSHEQSGTLRQDEWWELLFFMKRLEPQEQQKVLDMVKPNKEIQTSDLDDQDFLQMSLSVEVAQKVLCFLKDHSSGCIQTDLQCSHIYTKYMLHGGTESRSVQADSVTQDRSYQGGLLSKKPKTEEAPSSDGVGTVPIAEKTDLQLLKHLLDLEGPQPTDVTGEKSKAAGFVSSKGPLAGFSLEMLLDMLEKVKKSIGGADTLSFIIQVLEQKFAEEAQGAKSESRSHSREKIVKMLVELLTNQMKEKMLVATCLQLTYMVLAKYEWRVLFATEGGVRSVLACMQEHNSSAAVQHAGLSVLKVLTGVGSCELRGSHRPYSLNPTDAQVIKEIFSSIGSAASGSSTNLLRAIPNAISKMLTTPGCFPAVHNGLMVVRMLIENHKGLAEHLSSCDLPAVLQSLNEDTSDSVHGKLDMFMHRQLCELLRNSQEKADLETPDGTTLMAVQDMDLQSLLCVMKVNKMCRELLPSLERCVCDNLPSLSFEISELLTDADFFMNLLASLEQLRSEKRLQLSLVRILSKALDFYQEDTLPWHKSIEPCLTSLGSNSCDQELLQEVVNFLYRLATINKDCAVVMCRLGTKEILVKVLEKQSSVLLQASELRDLLTDCEKYASLYQKMATSILAGCIQMVLGQIEENRRSQQSINIPFFGVFLKNLCQGSNMEVKEDKCWEKIEVSSNPHRANKLTDGNPKSYWESNGSTGSHYINIYMHRGVVIRRLFFIVSSEDSSYMPARLVVMGGENASSINTELNSVNVSSMAGRVSLLENVTRFWPIIQIKIKRCQQGGIDTRVRGLEILGPKPTFWPVFKEQLCQRTFLFYTSRAHSWGQEICEKRELLLQLFNKLNRALSHEQEFAERFLTDEEAAQALGRTCWEALIAPLVQSITSQDNRGVSPLSWLFTRYLENAQVFSCRKSGSSVFNSRVRRLTHLLVHVDTSLPETEALKPLSKTSEKSRGGKVSGEKTEGKNPDSSCASVRGSMAGIAQCWQGVVQQQVQRFLEVSWNNTDLVSQFCSLYLGLRRAMEELFGQQTLFLLSLRQGFCEGLLHLSFLTALHVTEQFARYIDHMIKEIREDSYDLQLMNQLHQFLDFVLFLSDLELANSFEHFYRHYMADRLLSLGPCWLENSVVDQIGICFPNRFPQQMLRNLQEAKDLQRDQHLFTLQELDTGILAEDMEEGEVPEDDSVTIEEPEDSEVQVSVLSPRCWAVSPLCYMEDPSKYFPETLCGSLQKFSNFYSKSQSSVGLDITQLRRLQWTWLGNAELQYGALTLHVSSVQMFILLLFNQQEEVSEEHIIQSTGLSPVLVSHALTPLVAKGGILHYSPKPGLLCLNDVEVVEAGPRKSLRLLPKQTYLNVEEDEGRTLERKRNIIFCLITQIMKQEKELHIDNLVFRVIEASQKRESKRSVKILNFLCSHTDVLSCIMHLIGQGYMMRSEDSPQIVEYLSKDPTTPRKGKANINFQSAIKKKQENDTQMSPSSSGRGAEQGVLETIFLPLGSTLSQEEVWTLMNQIVSQVSEMLSVTSDVAQHLLIHCKWNVDLLLQKYTDDSESLLIASGLEDTESHLPENTLPICPVCVNPLSPAESPPTLCCKHYCCKSCWKEYLTTRIEQNLVLNCTCPTTDCPAQPTSDFIRNIISSKEVVDKYEKALLRGFVESCSNLTWCTNPQGCDRVLCKEGLGNGAACAKCSWLSCFTCSFPEAHYPASCSHMSQWMDDGGFYEGMTVEAQSKHLTKLISKHCPSCQAPIEKNEGCLHMTCAKCNHGFCWRCLKPWKPTHKDYYNCSAMVSKAARQEKRFQDYNERCTFQHRAKDFAISLRNRLSVLGEDVPLRTLTLLITSCKVLEQSRKVLGYSCVYSYYNQDSERLDVLESQTENLELHVSSLQILLEDSLLQSADLASCVKLLGADKYNQGLELVRRVQERLHGILQHSTQDFRVGYLSQPDQKDLKLSNVPAEMMTTTTDTADGTSDSGDTAGEQDDDDDEEYVPEWHEDYDEDLDEEDFSYDEDDGSENLEPDSFIFEDDDGETFE